MAVRSLARDALRAAVRSAPLSVFLLVYVLTCWIGGIALLFGPDWVRDSYVYSSGARIGHLTSGEVIKAVVLLTIAPLLLIAGWMAAGRLVRGRQEREPSARGALASPRWLAVAVVVVFGYLLIRLTAIGAPGELRAWLDYDDFIAQRSDVFDGLRFPEFVLAYSLAPLLTGAYIATMLGNDTSVRRVVIASTALLGLLFLLSLLLFQKRPLFVYLVLIGCVIAAHDPARERLRPLTSRRAIRRGLLVAMLAYGMYLVLLVTPVLRSSAGTDTGGLVPVGAYSFEEGQEGFNSAGPFTRNGASLDVTTGRTGDGLAITASSRRQGASLETSIPGRATSIWHLAAWVRSEEAGSMALVMGAKPGDRAARSATTGPKWRPIDVEWLAKDDTPSMVVAAQANVPGAYVLDDVRLYRSFDGFPPRDGYVSTDLQYRFDLGLDGWAAQGDAELLTAEGRTGIAMRVRAEDAGDGATIASPAPVEAGTPTGASLWLRSNDQTRVSVNFGEEEQRFETSRDWKQVRLRWTASSDEPDPVLTIRADDSGTFDVDEVTITRRGPPYEEPPAPSPVTDAPPTPSGGVAFPRVQDLEARSRGDALLFYALLAPFTRTSGPAVAYPSIFPERRDFYAIDLGLDVLGIGTAPDDNQVSFDLMYPDAARGQNSVPFIFSLFAQGGLLVALLGAAVIGALWRLAWWWATTRAAGSLTRAAVIGLLVLFGVFVAGDSARNAVLASYGVLWPLLAVAATRVLPSPR